MTNCSNRIRFSASMSSTACGQGRKVVTAQRHPARRARRHATLPCQCHGVRPRQATENSLFFPPYGPQNTACVISENERDHNVSFFFCHQVKRYEIQSKLSDGSELTCPGLRRASIEHPTLGPVTDTQCSRSPDTRGTRLGCEISDRRQIL